MLYNGILIFPARFLWRKIQWGDFMNRWIVCICAVTIFNVNILPHGLYGSCGFEETAYSATGRECFNIEQSADIDILFNTIVTKTLDPISISPECVNVLVKDNQVFMDLPHKE